jgi:hypothetical protein
MRQQSSGQEILMISLLQRSIATLEYFVYSGSMRPTIED